MPNPVGAIVVRSPARRSLGQNICVQELRSLLEQAEDSVHVGSFIRLREETVRRANCQGLGQ